MHDNVVEGECVDQWWTDLAGLIQFLFAEGSPPGRQVVCDARPLEGGNVQGELLSDAVARQDLLFVPTRPRRRGEGIGVELRSLPDGRRAIPVYTSLERLVDCCGRYQPWVAVDAQGFRSIEIQTKFDLALVDARIPVEHQNSREALDEEPWSDAPRSWMGSPLSTGNARRK